MRKRAFQGLKPTCMHVSDHPPPYFDIKKKQKLYKLVLLSKYGGGRPETCINVRLRPLNARLCLSQFFPHHILIIKPNTSKISFNIKNNIEQSSKKAIGFKSKRTVSQATKP